MTRVRTEFLSISKCPHLEQIATGSLATLKDLKTLTINENPSLKYIAPGFIEDAPKLAAIDLSQNSLYALEYSALETVILKLRALYLNGNKFNCHCSLRYVKTLAINENLSLKYIAPGFIENAPKFAAINLSQNSLYALEYSALETVILKLRALYLNGNKFNCHCSLRYVKKI